MRLSKIVVGGAQIGNNYGVVGKKLGKNEIIKIFNFFQKKKIVTYVDTSPYYGNSQKLLNLLPKKNLFIISKIKNIPKDLNKIENYINNFTQNLKNEINKKVFCIFLHDEKDLDNLKRLKKIKNVFLKLKKKNIIQNFGYSIYDFKKYKKKIFKIKPDILQFPYNILDNRVTVKDFKELKKKEIKIYVRSIFLQGLLLCYSKNLPKNFIKFSDLWREHEKELNKHRINRLQAALGFVNNNKMIDKFIIGFKSMKEFKQLLKCNLSKKKLNFQIKNKKIYKFLINPRVWK